MSDTQEPSTVQKIHRLFRAHDAAPADVASPLYRHLTREWADLHALPSTTSTVRRWARTETTLTGLATPGQIVDAIDAAGYERTNELLLALLRLFQAGHQLAGRVVLQALLPKLARIATHASGMCTSSGDTWAEDRRHITLAECWEVMATYPVDRRTRCVASNLTLDTLHRVTGVRRPPQDVPVDPHDFRLLEHLHDSDTNPGARRAQPHDITSPAAGELTPDADLLHVLTWGLSTRVITRGEAQLLAAAYLPEHTTGYGFADAAEALGMTQGAIRQRCSRAARQLTAAVSHELRTPAVA